MDLIYTGMTNIPGHGLVPAELGVLKTHSFDLSYGAAENDFELSLGVHEPELKPEQEAGVFVYVDGTEYGGIVDGLKTNSATGSRSYFGRTWHGLLNNSVLLESLTVTNVDANEAIILFLKNLNCLHGCFWGDEVLLSGVHISSYTFPRFTRGYDGLVKMLKKYGAKLKITAHDLEAIVRAEPIVDYTEQAIDNDLLDLKIERCVHRVNHLICLGSGQGEERLVRHIYAVEPEPGDELSEQFYEDAVQSWPQYYDYRNRTEIYDYPNANDASELYMAGVEKLLELRAVNRIETDVKEGTGYEYDIGDIIHGRDTITGNFVREVVTQKIVKIDNGVARIDYKTGV